MKYILSANHIYQHIPHTQPRPRVVDESAGLQKWSIPIGGDIFKQLDSNIAALESVNKATVATFCCNFLRVYTSVPLLVHNCNISALHTAKITTCGCDIPLELTVSYHVHKFPNLSQNSFCEMYAILGKLTSSAETANFHPFDRKSLKISSSVETIHSRIDLISVNSA